MPPLSQTHSIDTLGIFVGGSCFETAAALSILDHPGQAGETLDKFARLFSKTLDQVYAPEGLGNTVVRYNGKDVSLHALYDTKILSELRPGSDQIGRCANESLEKEWYKGAGVQWLKEQLAISSTSSDYTYVNTLTKIRVLPPFSAYIILDLMKDSQNAPVVARLLEKDVDTVTERCKTAKQLVWNDDFNSTFKRARIERPPLVGVENGPGVSLEGTPTRDGLTCTDFGYGCAFGQIYHPDDVSPSDLQEQYRADLRKFGQQGIRRVNQPIEDSARPGVLSEYAFEHMPAPFRLAGLDLQLASHRVPHGSGLNRWNPVGSYAQESRAHCLPVAGSHSAGAAYFFVGLNCLSEEPIVGVKKTAEQLGLLFSAFTNFGGYHTFVETFPIAQAIASNTKFKTSVDERQGMYGERLYEDFTQAAEKYTGAGKSVIKMKTVYQQCLYLS